MITVPKGKRVYIGARRFVEGEVLPPHMAFDLPVEKREEPEPEQRVKRPYTKRGKF
jgi:hypothetical protein